MTVISDTWFVNIAAKLPIHLFVALVRLRFYHTPRLKNFVRNAVGFICLYGLLAVAWAIMLPRHIKQVWRRQ